jgi:REP element-mobilizing transposase RayT
MGTQCCAIHAIWTTYGTWLPGDARGHWSALFDLYGHLKDRGHKLNLPDAFTHQRATQLMKEPPHILTPLDQSIVADTIADVLHNQMKSAARVYAGAVERSHVHLLFGRLQEDITRVVGRIKGRTSSEVLKRGTEKDRTRTWTEGY